MIRQIGSPASRMLLRLVALGAVVYGIDIVRQTSPSGQRIVYVVLGITMFWTAALTFEMSRAKAVANDEGIVIRNPFHTHRLRWNEIAAVDPAPKGMAFRLWNGQTLRAIAVSRRDWRRGGNWYDVEALEYYRAHLGIPVSQPPVDAVGRQRAPLLPSTRSLAPAWRVLLPVAWVLAVSVGIALSANTPHVTYPEPLTHLEGFVFIGLFAAPLLAALGWRFSRSVSLGVASLGLAFSIVDAQHPHQRGGVEIATFIFLVIVSVAAMATAHQDGALADRDVVP